MNHLTQQNNQMAFNQQRTNQPSNYQAQQSQVQPQNFQSQQQNFQAQPQHFQASSNFQPQNQVQQNFQAQPFNPQSYQAASNRTSQSFTTPQSFHTANYRGNQPGHDQRFRSDSTQPTQQNQYAGARYQNQAFAPSQQMGFNQPLAANQQMTSNPQFAANQQQFQTPQSFHGPNYRGNQHV